MAPSKRSRGRDHVRCLACHQQLVIDNYSRCRNCYREVDVTNLGDDTVGHNEDVKFASKYTSEPFCVVVGNSRKRYYIHRDILTAQIPYFTTMIDGSFKGTEASRSEVVLNSDADHEEAFDMLVDHLYHAGYVAEGTTLDAKSLLHARVYIQAEKLCMESLKQEALVGMIKLLAEAGSHRSYNHRIDYYRTTRTTDDSYQDVSMGTLAQIVELLYDHTTDYDQAANEAGSDADKKASVVKSTDRMRNLLARFAAHRLQRVKECPALMDLVRGNSAFATDLICCASDGTRVSEDDLKDL